MTRYWLCIIDKDNYKIVVQERVWGLNEHYKTAIDKFRKGDMLAFYVKGRKLGGIFQIDSAFFENRAELFSGGDFPYRVKLKPVKLPKNGIMDWDDDTIRKLQLFRNKQRWMLHLIGRAFCELSIGDFGYLYSKIE